jgi:hypothetical protein
MDAQVWGASAVRIAGGDSMLIKHPAVWRLRSSGGALLLAITGCSGGNNGMMASSPPSTMLTADFDSIQANIFTPICAGCHGGANPAANLSLDAAHSYNDLVNVPSTEQPTLDRVKPGDPTDSYLVIHLQKDGDGAPASDIPFVVQWIQDGALPGSQMAMSSDFKVAAVQPNPGDTLHAAPSRIVIGFTQELDPGALNPAAVRLERIDESAEAQGGRLVIPVGVSIPAHNARALLVTPESALAPGQYQVVLNMDQSAALRSQSGAPLYDGAPEIGERLVTRFSVAAK